MAQDDRGFFGNLPIAGILAIVLFASGLAVQHIPLESDRPASNGKQLRPSPDGQVIEARLWQDPFDAIQRHQEECPATAEQPPTRLTTLTTLATPKTPNAKCPLLKDADRFHQPGWLRSHLAETDLADTLILPVFIYGGPYAEDTEERRRYRYAVLSALRTSHYEPTNGRAVGYVQVNGGAPCASETDGEPAQPCRELGSALDGLLIPFERWKLNRAELSARENQPQHVVVLWLKEEWFSRDAQDRLNWLFKNLLPAEAKTDQLKLIGPNSYETAKTLLPADRLGCPKHDHAWLNGACSQFVSPAMTEPDERFKAAMMSPDDRQIVAAIIDELVNRKLELPTAARPDAPCNSDVAVVVESDTNYGRSLERSIRRALSACKPDDDRTTRRLHIYRYFRGLDGRVAFGTENSTKNSERNLRNLKEQPAAPQERAQGEGQFDYLLRVADAVRERNDKLNGKSLREHGIEFTPRGIRAVLVFGADVHDKLAVLHALREKMPSALFATNDLDAGLLRSNQLAWTRNLIVASGYDLDLWHVLQQGAAPFRDTYQTATFFATQLALRPALGEQDATRALRQQVKLFEIGNGEAIRIDKNESSSSPLLWLWAGAAMLALVGFVVVHSWCVRDTLSTRWPSVFALALLIGGYVAWVINTAGQPGEEPLSLTAGISVWPSEFIRFGVFLLATYWLHRVFVRLQAGDDGIGRSFFGQPYEVRKPLTLLERWHAIRDGVRAVFANGVLRGIRAAFPGSPETPADPRTKIDVEALWGEYRRWTRPTATVVRVGLGLVCYLVLALLIVPVDPPVAPVRGETSTLIDRLTISAAWLAAGALLIYTLDRVAVSTLFLRRLYGDHDHARDSDWKIGAGAEHCCGIDIDVSDNSAAAAAARSYVDLRLSAKLTASVGSIVLLPFVLTLLLILARSRYFDNWVMPVGLLAVFGFGLLLVTFCAFALRQSAERIRQLTIEALNRAEIAARAGSAPADTTGNDSAAPAAQPGKSRISPEQIKLMRDTASHLREGAFAPFAEQPIIRALVLPFGGAGLVSLVDWAIFM